MSRYFDHVRRSWKSRLFLVVFWQLITVVYVIASLINGQFKVETLLAITAATFGFGLLISLLSVTTELDTLNKVSGILSNINWSKLNVSDVKVTDKYSENGWGRTVFMRGVYQNKNIEIRHTNDKMRNSNRRKLFLVIRIQLEGEFYEDAAKVEPGKMLTVAEMTAALDGAITASNDPKFGEVFREMKRRDDGKRLRS